MSSVPDTKLHPRGALLVGRAQDVPDKRHKLGKRGGLFEDVGHILCPTYGFSARRYLLYFVIAGLLWVTGLVLSNLSFAQTATPADLQSAMERIQQGYSADARQRLEQIIMADPSGRLGDHAALLLGNLLLQQQHFADALPPLRRAANGVVGSLYARFLLTQTVVVGELTSAYTEADEQIDFLQQQDIEEVSAILREKTAHLAVKLAFLQGHWTVTVAAGNTFVDQWPTSNLASEVHWLTAEAAYQAGQWQIAHELYTTIWYKTPGSAWALKARDRLRQLERDQRLPFRRLPKAEHYAFIKALRAVGLHDDALTEGEDFLSRYPGDDKTAAVLLLKAASLHTLRRNDASIATVELMRHRYPRSPHTPEAAIIAIKCLRRLDNTMAIRGWVDWIIQTYPRSPVAAQALFELGVYLGNVGSEAEGIQVLQRLFQPDNQSFPLLDDALWKTAWMQRRLGRTEAAVTTLEQLLRDYPTSGFRKAALYWVARWDADRAADYYQILLREFPNDYYGHLALENLLNRDIKPRQMGTSKPFPPIDLLDKRETRPDAPTAYIKAIQLKQIGLYEFAADELASLPNIEHNPGLQLALADLYARAGNSHQAFSIVDKYFREFIVAGSLDRNRIPVEFWRIVYPFNHRAEIEQALKEAKLAATRIDPYLIAALIRMESRFQTNAISKAGAIGLMQLLPETAERTAIQAGLDRVTRADLFNPATNIRLGIFYLAQRVKDFDGDWFPAICSYNGGVGPVRQWWGNKPADQPLDEFIENIPYLETRLYIKQILGDYHNYERLYAESAE